MKQVYVFLIALVVVAGGAFYGGTTYQNSKNAAVVAEAGGVNAPGGANGGTRNMRGTGGTRGGQGGGIVTGQILEKNDTSLTVQMGTSGTKIVLFSSSTPVRKTVEVTGADLKVGATVVVNGTAGSDGAVVADQIQLRDASSTFRGGPKQ